MLLVSDSNTIDDQYNVDDQLGEKIEIPTVIIPKNVGDIIRDGSVNPEKRVTISIKFKGVKENGNLYLDLFFSSDDTKALNFFIEFDQYKNRLGEKFIFTPVYKYYIYPYADSSNKHDPKETVPCIKDTKFCANSNPSLKIENPRLVLMENLRQSCIYRLYVLDIYWNYMKTFAEICGDELEPVFTNECSLLTMKNVGGINGTEVDNCINTLIQTEGKVEDDYEMYNKKKIFKIPEILINDVKYRGTWYSKYIFNTICAGFLDDKDICKPVKSTTKKSQDYLNIVAWIGFSIFMIMLILLICYRRFVNKILEQRLNDRIQISAISAIGSYKTVKEERLTNSESLEESN